MIEEPDFDALSSLGVSRQIVDRLRNRPLSRLLCHFSIIVLDGEEYRDSIEEERKRGEREIEYYRKVETVIEKSLEDWLTAMRRPPFMNREAIQLGMGNADFRKGVVCPGC